MSGPCYGRFQVPEPQANLLVLHQRTDEITLGTVDWEPKVGVLDQSDLISQGIDTSTLISGAAKVDALGSCTANTATEAVSNVLDEAAFGTYLQRMAGTPAVHPYAATAIAEEASIVFYHQCTDQTGDPSQEWPPTDCGSSGPYVVDELLKLGVIKDHQVAHGADNIVSLLQSGGLMMGTPFLNAWETPGADGMIDGNGTVSTVEAQIRQGVAGGHEIYLSAIETLTLYHTGVVNPWETIVRFRNHWTASWGDHGSFRAHLSTFSHILGSYTDFRQVSA